MDEGLSEMFTGRIGEIGEVIGVSGTQTVVRAPKSAGRLRPGGSLTVAGVCMTAEDIADGQIVASLSEETRRRTTFDRCTGGERVNIETALAFGDPLDGHLVQGHVDAVGKVAGIDAAGTGRRIWIRPPDRFLRRVVAKGSIAVDGVYAGLRTRARGHRTFSGPGTCFPWLRAPVCWPSAQAIPSARWRSAWRPACRR